MIMETVSEIRQKATFFKDQTRQEWSEVLRALARGKRIKRGIRPGTQELIKLISGLSFRNAVEKEIYCLDLSLLMEDKRFPLIWDKRHLALLLKIQRPRQEAGNFVALLMPAALKNKKGLAFYPVLSKVMDKMERIPSTAMQWLEVLGMIERFTPLSDVIDLTRGRGLDRFDVKQLQEFRTFRSDQIRALTYFFTIANIEDAGRLDLVFFFVKNNFFSRKKMEEMVRMIRHFVAEALPLAERRLQDFGFSFLDRSIGEEGLQKAYGLFLLWVFHQPAEQHHYYLKDQPGLLDQAKSASDTHQRFCQFRFAEVVRFLPVRWLWDVPFMMRYHPRVLLHLAAGMNIRTCSDLCIPVNKKVAHLFHNLPPAAMLPENGLNISLRHIYWQYLGISEQLFPVVEQYAAFEWFVYRTAGPSYRIRNRHLDQFPRWEEVLRKIVRLCEELPELPTLDFRDHGALFGYFQHLIDEKLPLNLPGSTLKSIQRRVAEWQQEALRRQELIRKKEQKLPLIWRGPGYRRFARKADDLVYTITQLNTLKALTEEGKALRHCVASYHMRCAKGHCSIWSLRQSNGQHIKPLVTIEINENDRIVQVRGKHNTQPTAGQLKMIKAWANKEGLKYSW
jgi:hypothetical protein